MDIGLQLEDSQPKMLEIYKFDEEHDGKAAKPIFYSENFTKILAKVRDKKVILVSVFGVRRTGKSLLLEMIRLELLQPGCLKDPKTKIGGVACIRFLDGDEAGTKGIEIWSEPIPFINGLGEECSLLLVDTKGFFDHRAPPIELFHTNAILALWSNLLVYNVSNIDQSDIKNFALNLSRNAMDFAFMESEINAIEKPILIFCERNARSKKTGHIQGHFQQEFKSNRRFNLDVEVLEDNFAEIEYLKIGSPNMFLSHANHYDPITLGNATDTIDEYTKKFIDGVLALKELIMAKAKEVTPKKLENFKEFCEMMVANADKFGENDLDNLRLVRFSVANVALQIAISTCENKYTGEENVLEEWAKSSKFPAILEKLNSIYEQAKKVHYDKLQMKSKDFVAAEQARVEIELIKFLMEKKVKLGIIALEEQTRKLVENQMRLLEEHLADGTYHSKLLNVVAIWSNWRAIASEIFQKLELTKFERERWNERVLSKQRNLELEIKGLMGKNDSFQRLLCELEINENDLRWKMKSKFVEELAKNFGDYDLKSLEELVEVSIPEELHNEVPLTGVEIPSAFSTNLIEFLIHRLFQWACKKANDGYKKIWVAHTRISRDLFQKVLVFRREKYFIPMITEIITIAAEKLNENLQKRQTGQMKILDELGVKFCENPEKEKRQNEENGNTEEEETKAQS